MILNNSNNKVSIWLLMQFDIFILSLFLLLFIFIIFIYFPPKIYLFCILFVKSFCLDFGNVCLA